MSESRVVDALCSLSALESLLRALHVQIPPSGLKEGENISCPMPGHEDRDPSCTVRGKTGQFYCQSLCQTILPLDLIVAHGKAKDRAEAARFVEELFRLPTDNPSSMSNLGDPVLDPSLTVEQYLGMRQFPRAIADKFNLADGLTYVSADGHARAAYTPGQFSVVVMPTRDGDRPRVRSAAPGGKIKWAGRIRYTDGRRIDYGMTGDDALPRCVYGLPQLAPSALLPSVLIVVEGESDTHALHAMDVPCVVGVPGAGMASNVSDTLLEACAMLGHGDPGEVTVCVWQEPGAAGAGFPRSVAEAITREAQASKLRQPQFVTLSHTAVPGNIKDPCDLWMDRGEAGRHEIVTAVQGLLPSAGDLVSIPSQQQVLSATPTEIGDEDPWVQLANLKDAPPIADLAPVQVERDIGKFRRTARGWSVVKKNAEGHEVVTHICSPVLIERVETNGDERQVIASAPTNGVWYRDRYAAADLASGERVQAALVAKLGIGVSARHRPDVVNLITSLTMLRSEIDGVQHVPMVSGWHHDNTANGFVGIEVDSSSDTVHAMFEANKRRRERCTKRGMSVQQTARKWWDEVVAPLITIPDPEDAHSGHAAPMLALGACAAAPSLLPLSSVGVEISPVAWISGLGGGGKTMLQAICASIYAPKSMDKQSQRTYFMSADITKAALYARTEILRDLPMILDDVTQMQALVERGKTTIDAKIQAAAGLGMQIFNRHSVERATRNGSIRNTKPFRCTGLFSAEASMRDNSGATLTAGHWRRITSATAKPMDDRNVGRSFAEDANIAMAELGGAPGECLVALVRKFDAERAYASLHYKCYDVVKGADDIDATQASAIASQMVGFAQLFHACGVGSIDEGIELAIKLIDPWLNPSDGDTDGATKRSETSQSDRALRAVKQMYASHRDRFLTSYALEEGSIDTKQSAMSALGKEITFEDRRALALFKTGADLLATNWGIDPGAINEARAAGYCRKSERIYAGGLRIRATVWFIDQDDDDEPSDNKDSFDNDPHDLVDDALAYWTKDTEQVEEQVEEHAPVEAASDYDRMIGITAMSDTGEVDVASVTFRWTTGLYEIEPDQGAHIHEAVHEKIRLEAQQEFDSLKEYYSELAPGGVADLLPDGDPRWEKIDAIGREAAQAQWPNVSAKATQLSSGHGDIIDSYVQAYRVLLMCRLRHPEWFVEETHAD